MLSVSISRTNSRNCPRAGTPPPSYFPDLVAVSTIASVSERTAATVGPYALFMGFPFERKGVDVLIRAFHRVSNRFPELTLKVVGYCPDLTPYRELAANNPRISFLPGQPHERAMELMAGCVFFVLPSRAEGVLACSSRRWQRANRSSRHASTGSRTWSKTACTGLLVEPDDVEGLAAKMELLLGDADLAARLASEGIAAWSNISPKIAIRRDFGR